MISWLHAEFIPLWRVAMPDTEQVHWINEDLGFGWSTSSIWVAGHVWLLCAGIGDGWEPRVMHLVGHVGPLLGILGRMDPEFGGGYFGVETLLGDVAATMFSEDGVKHLVWITPRDISSPWFGPSLFGEDFTQFIPRGWRDALLNLDLGLHWDLDLANDLNTFTEWEVNSRRLPGRRLWVAMSG